MLGKKSVEQINAKISSIIGADMVVDGDIRAKEAVRVEGSVTGDVETEGALIISSSGKVKGNVKGSSIIIGGSLEGDLTSGGRTEVASTGKVIGNIRTKSLVVDRNSGIPGTMYHEYRRAFRLCRKLLPMYLRRKSRRKKNPKG